MRTGGNGAEEWDVKKNPFGASGIKEGGEGVLSKTRLDYTKALMNQKSRQSTSFYMIQAWEGDQSHGNHRR